MKKILLLCFLLSSCARAPLSDPAQAYRPADPPASLADAYDLASFKDALAKTLAAFQKGENIPLQYAFGDRIVGREDYRKALEALQPQLDSYDHFLSFVKTNFDFYEVYGGDDGWGHVFVTGYYDPVVPGSRKKTARFSRALYRSPPDLVKVDLTAYAERFPDLEPLQKIREQSAFWRGRYDPLTHTVQPYYQRAEIDGQGALDGKGLALAWLDPVDAFFLEVQGSGVVHFADGKELRVGYDGQNGYPYEPIGRFLTDRVPLEQMSMQRIRQELDKMTPEARDKILFQNPSHVFFKALKGKSLTYCGAEVTPGRTIATDSKLIPKGTLNFLEIELPVFADASSLDPSGWEQKNRWVFNQDTGGAIRGGGRVDLYMGQGPEAERTAGVMKRSGKLWVIAPKESFLERLREPSLQSQP